MTAPDHEQRPSEPDPADSAPAPASPSASSGSAIWRAVSVLLSMAAVAALAVGGAAFVVVREEMDRRVELTRPVTIEVRPGESLASVAPRLLDAGLVGNERMFLWLAARRGADRAIKHGRHEFQGTLSFARVLEELSRDPQPFLRVTIPEGLTLRQIAALLEEAGATSASAYRAVACSQELRRLVAAPEAAACAEGYLFPDTYELLPGMSAGDVIDLQVRRFRNVVDPLLARHAANGESRFRQAPIDGDLGRLLTLASIVEKETGQAAERARIAAVFYNRLRIGMRLQTDPTVIYGVIDSGEPWDGNLTRTHLETETPYNTYVRGGLPPGPISNPGLAALEAVLEPEDDRRVLYFVARGDGSHQFSTSLADHNRAVRRFQLR